MDNRENILDVTLKLFCDKGYDAVSVQEIVEAAGITKPTLYYYFKSKYGLLEELLNREFDKFNECIRPGLTMDNSDVGNQLFEVAKEFLSYAVSNNKFFYFMLSLMYSPRSGEPYQAVKPHLSDLYGEVIAMFDRASGKLGNMNDRQEQFAMGFLGLINQYAFTFSAKHADKDYVLRENVSDEAVRALVKQFMYGIVN